MVVLRIEGEHFGDEFLFACWIVQAIDNSLAVMPYLVILLVFEGRGVKPLNFGAKGKGQVEEGAGAVEPIRNLLVSGVQYCSSK